MPSREPTRGERAERARRAAVRARLKAARAAGSCIHKVPLVQTCVACLDLMPRLLGRTATHITC